jgi:hypothetical protein
MDEYITVEDMLNFLKEKLEDGMLSKDSKIYIRKNNTDEISYIKTANVTNTNELQIWADLK